MKKKICLIHTGGTIGMVRTSEGFSPKAGYMQTILDKIEDLRAEGMPKYDLVELDPLLDSSDMAVDDWNRIGEVIAARYSAYDGFVILHGTDTMAYTASALSFMLENLDKPVVLTGSQIPLSEVRSDGLDNLITSIIIAADGKHREVLLYFGGRLLRGNRATKMSADDLIAFDSPNFPHLAHAGMQIKYYPAVDQATRAARVGEFSLCRFESVPIGVLKIFPGISFPVFENLLTEKLRGIVLEGFGAGNIPGEGHALLPIIRRAFEAGSVITVTSQCPQGTISLGTYKASAPLKAAGAVSGFDMTTEACVAKLYYLFSKGYSKTKIKELMETDICGEMSRSI